MGAPEMITMSVKDLEALLDKKAKEIAAAQPSQMGDLAASLKDIAKHAQKTADDVAQTRRKENANPPQISVFSYPEGNLARPKPVLTYETYYCGQRLRGDELTPAEIDLFNRFEGSKEARHGQWQAKVDRNGTSTRLEVVVPSQRNDQRMDLPSLELILMELLDGPDVVDPMKSIAKLVEMQERIKALEDQLKAKSKAA